MNAPLQGGGDESLSEKYEASFSGLNSLSLGPGGEAGSSLCAAGVQGWARVAGGGGTSEAGSRSTSRPMSQVQLAPLGPMDFSQGAARARPQTVPAHSPWLDPPPGSGPRLQPASQREEVLLLQRWVHDAVQKLSSQEGRGAAAAGGADDLSAAPAPAAAAAAAAADAAAPTPRPGGPGGEPREMLDGALHACEVALSELQRQVAAECRERGELLAAVSGHMASLVQLKVGFEYESRLAGMHEHMSRAPALNGSPPPAAALELSLALLRQSSQAELILATAMRQQLKELESQLAAARAHGSEALVKMEEVSRLHEERHAECVTLRAEIATSRMRQVDAEQKLGVASAKLQLTSAELAEVTLAHREVSVKLSHETAAAALATSSASRDVKTMTGLLGGAQEKLRAADKRGEDLEAALKAQRDSLRAMCAIMGPQGVTGLPHGSDPSWEDLTASGSAQAVLGILAQHLPVLWDHGQAQLAALEGMSIKYALESEARKKLQVVDLSARVASLQSSTESLRAQVDHLLPFERKAKELETDANQLAANLDIATTSWKLAEELQRQMLAEVSLHEDIAERAVALKDEMVKQNLELQIISDEAVTLRTVKIQLTEEIEGMRVKAQQTSDTHADTCKQLELAKFFLQTVCELLSCRCTLAPLPHTLQLLPAVRAWTPGPPFCVTRLAAALPPTAATAASAPARVAPPNPPAPHTPPSAPGSAQQGLHKPNRSGSNRSSDSPDQERGDRGGGVGDGNGLDGSGGAVGEFGPAGSGGGTPACAQPASAAALSVQEVLTARPSTTGVSAQRDPSEPGSAAEGDVSLGQRPMAEQVSLRGSSRGTTASARQRNQDSRSGQPRPGSGSMAGDGAQHSSGPMSSEGAMTAPDMSGVLVPQVKHTGGGGGIGANVWGKFKLAARPRGRPPTTPRASRARLAHTHDRLAREPRHALPITRRSAPWDHRTPQNSLLVQRPRPPHHTSCVTRPSRAHTHDRLSHARASSRPSHHTQIGILAWFCKRLRAQLVAESERRARMEVELAETHVHYAEAMVAREVFICEGMMGNLPSHARGGLQEGARQTHSLKSHMIDLRMDMNKLAGATALLVMGLKRYKDREQSRVDKCCQTGEEIGPEWFDVVRGLMDAESRRGPRQLAMDWGSGDAPAIARSDTAPGLPPPAPGLTLTALLDTIVKVYVRKVGTVQDVPCWGVTRTDTMFDALMDHYSAQRAPGLFAIDFLSDPEGPMVRWVQGPMVRLFSSCRRHSTHPKVAMFARFTGASADGVFWRSDVFHFLLHLLYCLRVLLAGSWRSSISAWASERGCQIPIQAVYDLVGNLFNVQSPTELDGAVGRRLGSLVLPGHTGPAVDLDALLLLLVNEHQAGTCPCNAMLFPRRLTDGSLFNVFNTVGFSPHMESITPSRNSNQSPPQAPTSAVKQRSTPAADHPQHTTFSVPAVSGAQSPASCVSGSETSSTPRPVSGPSVPSLRAAPSLHSTTTTTTTTSPADPHEPRSPNTPMQLSRFGPPSPAAKTPPSRPGHSSPSQDRRSPGSGAGKAQTGAASEMGKPSSIVASQHLTSRTTAQFSPHDESEEGSLSGAGMICQSAHQAQKVADIRYAAEKNAQVRRESQQAREAITAATALVAKQKSQNSGDKSVRQY
ncbi:MAG: hypothetical protein WDW38_003970 [Sanguina aurantia]